jgi:hypothetical protein
MNRNGIALPSAKRPDEDVPVAANAPAPDSVVPVAP